MADTHTRYLCAEIIHSQFGPLTAKLASVLLTRGRLSFLHLVRFSSLRPRLARACILVLVQQNILWHTKGDDEGEMFEINVDECLMRLRFGKFVWLAEKIYGKQAADIVQIVLDHGKLRPPEILSLLSVYDLKKIKQYRQIVHKLVSESYLKVSTILSHLSPRDKWIQYESEEKRKITGFPTAKELREAKEAAHARLKREEEEAEQVGLKRKAKDQQSGPYANKRKLSENEDVINDDIYFRVNYERFGIHLRSAIIEKAAKERFNHPTSLVVRAAMKVTENSHSSLNDARSVPTSVASIAMYIPEGADLASGLMYSSKKVSNMTCIKDYLGMLASADNPTPEGKAASFISYSSSKVQVEFDIIKRRLRKNILESVARDKHGQEGVRILRLLAKTGKMDEKQISKMVMMAPKDVRPLLVALSADSLISTQEVPKLLRYVDHQKAFHVILGRVYKTLYNILARRRAEREHGEVAAVLDKRARSDVSQDESLLTRVEREILDDWEVKEGKLTALEMRVEEIVFLLKDLGGLPADSE
ncbi:RNA polymerase III subunit RPC82-domain-containing protein [Gymnopilus junonius]|uniref:DNA-directed RNA polymerase III subunit RPC3 n=1 Tax=Gymnopilus junonius TaxID=109634 RepID=A0A9P5NUT4_GYMJU|nr:RNA polymerase III subunit RPC82-domain-containing protein [Gymnopilus junonius]